MEYTRRCGMLGYGTIRGRVVMPYLALLCVAGFTFFATSQAQSAPVAQILPQRVLILYSYDREEGIFAEFDRSLRSQLTAQSHERVQFFTEYLDIVRFNSPEHARQVEKLLEAKYSELKPDLVVPV